MLDKRILEIIACPKCKGDLEYDSKKDILICRKDGIFYEVKNNIPILLIDKAKKLDEN